RSANSRGACWFRLSRRHLLRRSRGIGLLTMAAPIAERGPALPSGARAYRRIGPFGAEEIPAGLLRRHELKKGAWGLLTLVAGSILFHWDDEKGGSRL